MAGYARFVEALAMTLHTRAGFDNQSTTTVAYNRLNQTLYVTHQGDKRFDNVIGRDVTVRLTFGGRVVREAQVHFPPRPNWAQGMKKVGSNANAIQAWFAQARDLVLSKPEKFDAFVGRVAWIKVVMNQDLFMVKPPSLSGFHGESGIIRFLYLKDVRGMTAEGLADLHPRIKTAPDLIRTIEERFRESFAGHVFMGSSQGACQACAGYMGHLSIAFHSEQPKTKDRTDTWVHPITLTTAAHHFEYPVTRGVVLTRTAGDQRDERAAWM